MQMQKNSRIYTYTYKEHLANEKSRRSSPTQKYTQTDKTSSEDQTVQREKSKHDQIRIDSAQ